MTKVKDKKIRLLGAHISAAGGLLKMLAKAKQLGCNCVQIFASNPRSWQGQPITEKEAKIFKTKQIEYGVEELIIHAIYLVNLGSPKKEVYEKSIQALKNDLLSATRLGVKKIVVHPGSDLGEPGGEERLLKALRKLEKEIPSGGCFLLEGMSGTKNSLGNLATLGSLCKELGKKFGVCLDSAHLWASGYALDTEVGFNKLIKDLKKYNLYSCVKCIHLNDSKKLCGSHRDMHENLGKGFITSQGLSNMLNYNKFKLLPFIIETPGFENQGPDKKNMQIMKNMAE